MILSLNEAIELVIINNDSRFDKWLKDSVIQRFEYSIEWIWKLLKYFLWEEHWEDLASPKLIIKWACKVWIIDNMWIFIDMIDKRNRLSHDYHQDFSELSYEKITKEYIIFINKFLENIHKYYE